MAGISTTLSIFSQRKAFAGLATTTPDGTRR